MKDNVFDRIQAPRYRKPSTFHSLRAQTRARPANTTSVCRNLRPTDQLAVRQTGTKPMVLSAARVAAISAAQVMRSATGVG